MKEWDPSPEEVSNGYIKGWMISSGSGLALRNWHGVEVLRNAVPVAQRGSLQIYHGSYYLPMVAAGILARHAFKILHAGEPGDHALAEKYLVKAVGMNPEMWGSEVELGNLAIEHKDKTMALHWFVMARDQAKDAPEEQKDIAAEVERVQKAAPDAMTPMRNPMME
ncbi:hypothetical protein [Terriglobus tenax]|uniref:hypothetical protein n=1 Tax=Terriglobus tenax TaxID=1111115 RepID=UPI0021E0A402|nr:hypothetical protein [Terriglobus tenax]